MCAEAIPEGRECAQPLMGAHVRQAVRRTTRIVLLNDMIYHCPALKKYPGLFFTYVRCVSGSVCVRALFDKVLTPYPVPTCVAFLAEQYVHVLCQLSCGF